MERAGIERQLVVGFRAAGRTGLAELVHSPDFVLWVATESGWSPTVVSGRTNQGMVNGGLFQFWYGHTWTHSFFSHGNDPHGRFTMPVEQQARSVVQYFPHITAETVRGFARQVRSGTYRGWG